MRGEIAQSFIARCAEENDVDQLVADFVEKSAVFGFSAVAAGGWVGVGAERFYRFYFNTWPAEWAAIYQRENVFENDPIVAEARRSMKPFLWSDIRDSPMVTTAEKKIFELADSFGWRTGFAVPIHGPASYVGLIAFAAMEKASLTAADRTALEFMAIAIHRRCHATPGFGIAPASAPLTARQNECLRWVAVGKSDFEIATLLGLSQATVHFHIEEAKRRIGVRSRVQLVARLVLEGVL
jgi:LuxR family quorum sensing-dependent transcriptional regulator